jgi:hypothetical protein
MKQILHIFRKDARHHWPEIGVSVALLMVYAWTHSRHWQAHATPFDLREFMSGLVVPLVPISWCLLVARVVQGENLVGDRQFWVTRPYEWKKLLVAKVLFVLVFLNVPLLIVEAFLLADAGFQPMSHVGGLLFMQVLMWLVLVIPMEAAAAVTSTIVQILLLALGTGLYFIGFAWLIAEVPNTNVSSASEFPSSASGIIAVAACALVVVWQYARRKTWSARLVLIGGAALVLLIGVATPYGALIEREYPELAAGQSPVEIALGAVTKPEHQAPPDISMVKDEVSVNLPLEVFGILPGTLIVIDGTQFTVTAPQEPPWKSHWQGANTVLWPDRQGSSVAVEIPGKFFDQVRSTSVKVHVTMALTVFREENARTVIAAGGDFSAPDVGICSVSDRRSMNVLDCRSPLRKSAFIASIDTGTMTCPAVKDKPPAPAGIRLTYENWDETSGPAETGISPVETMNLYFANWADPPGKYGVPGACQGTPVRFTTPERMRRLRTEIEFNDVRIGDYASWNGIAVDFSSGTDVHVR